MMKKIVQEKLEKLKNTKKTGIEELARLAQISVLQDVLIENFKRERK